MIHRSHIDIQFVENGLPPKEKSSISKPVKPKRPRSRNQKRRSNQPAKASPNQQKSEPPQKKRKPSKPVSKPRKNPTPQKSKKPSEPKKRNKKLQSEVPQTPILVRGKVFKPILRKSKRRLEFGSYRKPSVKKPSAPQPLSPKPESRPSGRQSRDKTPQPQEMSWTPLLRRSARLKKTCQIL